MKEIASFSATTKRLRRLIEQSSGEYHDDLLIRPDDSALYTLMQTNGRNVVSYCTWEDGYFDSLEGSGEALVPTGGHSDARGLLDYLDLAGNESGVVEITLLQDGEVEGRFSPLATHLRAEGALNAQFRLPSSDDDLDAVPWDHSVRWTPDEQYVSQSCLVDGELPEDPDEWVVGPSIVETSPANLRESVIEPAEFLDTVDYRPVAIEDGQFVLDIGDERGDQEVWGEVNANRVEGPDIERAFLPDAFDSIVGSFGAGSVRIQTAPSGDGVEPPATFVSENSTHVVRHLVAALAPGVGSQ